MIQIQGLSKSYGSQILFKDVTFSLGKGERVGVTGRNGHGKTTLFRLILGMEEPDNGTIFIPQDYHIGHIAQKLVFSKSSVIEEASLGLRHTHDGADLKYKVETILSGLGFSSNQFLISPLELSGGYQVRLNLAKLLISEPDLLLLDEPTNYLDIVSCRWIKCFLTQWKGEIMLITHDREFMDSITTHTLGLHRGRFRKIEGSTRKLDAQIAQEEEIHEQTRLNQVKDIRRAEDYIRRFRSKARRASTVQSRIKALDKLGRLNKLDDVASLDFRFNESSFDGKWLLRVEGASFHYGEHRHGGHHYEEHDAPSTDLPWLFRDLTFSVQYGDRIGVIGKNGRGKTTLLRVLAKELTNQEGDVSFSSNAIVSHFGQTNVDRLNPERSVEEEIMGELIEKNRTKARTICGFMMFEGDMALKKVSVLSGGERSRVLLGKIVATPSNMLLLDEPTNHLDIDSSEALVDAIKHFHGGVIVISHSEELIREIANRLIVFDGSGAFLFEGGYDDFLQRIGWEDEGLIEGRKNAKDSSNSSNPVNKKEKRKARAEIIQRRSQVIRPLENNVTKLETEIQKIEQEIEDQTNNLIEKTKNGFNDETAKMSRVLHQKKAEQNKLYDLLEKASDSLELAQKQFEAELQEIEANS